VKITEPKNGETIFVIKKAEDICDHNEMIWHVNRWKCAKCGYVYGYNREKSTCL
jgi:ribosomal protein S27AE